MWWGIWWWWWQQTLSPWQKIKKHSHAHKRAYMRSGWLMHNLRLWQKRGMLLHRRNATGRRPAFVKVGKGVEALAKQSTSKACRWGTKMYNYALTQWKQTKFHNKIFHLPKSSMKLQRKPVCGLHRKKPSRSKYNTHSALGIEPKTNISPGRQLLYQLRIRSQCEARFSSNLNGRVTECSNSFLQKSVWKTLSSIQQVSERGRGERKGKS